METLQNLLDSSTVPALTALLLGLLSAISPCPLATNIAAMGYLAREVDNRRRIFVNGLLTPQDASSPTRCSAQPASHCCEAEAAPSPCSGSSEAGRSCSSAHCCS